MQFCEIAFLYIIETRGCVNWKSLIKLWDWNIPFALYSPLFIIKMGEKRE